MRGIVAFRNTHHAFHALFQRRGPQTRTGDEACVNHVAQNGFNSLAKRTRRIGAGEAVIERDAGILCGDEHVLFDWQVHRVDHAFNVAWPREMGMGFYHAGHQCAAGT